MGESFPYVTLKSLTLGRSVDNDYFKNILSFSHVDNFIIKK